MTNKTELINNIDKIHTTDMGEERIKRNLKLDIEDVVDYCKKIVLDKDSNITRKGKNWYIQLNNTFVTINASSYTIITAHKKTF